MTIIKSEVIENMISHFPAIPEKHIVNGINQILQDMSDTLASGNRIEIRGFGSFSLHYHSPRNAHNPRTGEKVTTHGKYSPHFKPGKQLRLKIDQSKADTAILNDSKGD
jgi:integration host factor subunit beta